MSVGSIYTKPWIVNFMLDLMGYTSDKPLWKTTIIEPCFGEGIFVEEIIDRIFISLNKYEYSDLYSELKDSVRAFEIDQSAYENGYLKIFFKLNKWIKDEELTHKILDKWLINDNFLLFDHISADFIVGNPPYIRAGLISAEYKNIYKNSFKSFTDGTDLYIAFFEKSLNCLKDSIGKMCFICSDRWMQNKYGKKLRSIINDNFHISEVIRMHDVEVFEENVTAYPAITLIDQRTGPFKYAYCNSNFTQRDYPDILKSEIELYELTETDSYSITCLPEPKDDSVIAIASPKKVKNVLKLAEKYPPLEETGVKIGIGLATGRDAVFLVQQDDIVEKDRMLPAFNMKIWRSNQVDKRCWIINPWTESGSLVKLDEYPKLRFYLESHKNELEKRYVAKRDPDAWYRTIDKVRPSLIDQPKLLFPDLAKKSAPIYSDELIYPCHDTYWLTSDSWDLKVLGGLLMSDIAESFIDVLGVKMRGNTMRFQAQYLKLIHIPYPSSISPEDCESLKKAFDNKDYDLSNRMALKIYGESE